MWLGSVVACGKLLNAELRNLRCYVVIRRQLWHGTASFGTTYGNIVARAECDVRACPAKIEIGLAFVALRHHGRASFTRGFVEVL